MRDILYVRRATDLLLSRIRLLGVVCSSEERHITTGEKTQMLVAVCLGMAPWRGKDVPRMCYLWGDGEGVLCTQGDHDHDHAIPEGSTLIIPEGASPEEAAQIMLGPIEVLVEDLRKYALEIEYNLARIASLNLPLLGAFTQKHYAAVITEGGPEFRITGCTRWAGEAPPTDGQKVWLQNSRGEYSPGYLERSLSRERSSGGAGAIFGVFRTAEYAAFDRDGVLEGDQPVRVVENRDLATVLPRNAATDQLVREMVALAEKVEQGKRDLRVLTDVLRGVVVAPPPEKTTT